jgi:hypothetical protein
LLREKLIDHHAPKHPAGIVRFRRVQRRRRRELLDRLGAVGEEGAGQS